MQVNKQEQHKSKVGYSMQGGQQHACLVLRKYDTYAWEVTNRDA